MLKFIRGKGQQPTAERQKIQRELFAFRKVRVLLNLLSKCASVCDFLEYEFIPLNLNEQFLNVALEYFVDALICYMCLALVFVEVIVFGCSLDGKLLRLFSENLYQVINYLRGCRLIERNVKY